MRESAVFSRLRRPARATCSVLTSPVPPAAAARPAGACWPPLSGSGVGVLLGGTRAGFGIFPAKFIIPHFDAIPGLWKPLVYGLKSQLRKGQRMLGVDENTALVGQLNGEWKVMGKGRAHVFTNEKSISYENGQSLSFD